MTWKRKLRRWWVLGPLIAGLLFLALVLYGERGPRPETACLAYLNIIVTELRDYVADHGGSLPADLEQAIDDPRILLCPLRTSLLGGNEAARLGAVDYVYLGAGFTAQEMEGLPDPGFPIVFDKKGNHADHTRCVFFCYEMTKDGALLPGGGYVRWMSEDEFQTTVQQLVRECTQVGRRDVAERLSGYLEAERGPGER
jgi:hypothetical protein